MKKSSLLTQILGINVLLVLGSVLVAALVSGARVEGGRGGAHWEFLVLVLAVAITLPINSWLLRREFEPLERLIETMEQVDLASGARRAHAELNDTEEVVRLNRTFNRMLDRIEADRRSSARAVLRAQEDERRRVAQDLHDEVNQALTGILLRIEATSHHAPPELRPELIETKQLANQAMDELLALARQLRPTALDDHGLVAALGNQVADFAKTTGIDATFTRRGDARELSGEQQIVIYRVAQEALSNIAQHSEATTAEVELSFVGRTQLRVSDNGRGFQEIRNGGLGVSGMKERALLVGGRLTVDSTVGSGTTIMLSVD